MHTSNCLKKQERKKKKKLAQESDLKTQLQQASDITTQHVFTCGVGVGSWRLGPQTNIWHK